MTRLLLNLQLKGFNLILLKLKDKTKNIILCDSPPFGSKAATGSLNRLRLIADSLKPRTRENRTGEPDPCLTLSATCTS